MSSRHIRVGGALALLLLMSACGEFAPPTTAAECAEAADNVDGARSSDVSSGWRIAYSEESRPLGSSGTLYLCSPDEFAATVSSDFPAGIAVDPNPLGVLAGSDIIEELSVTVTAGDEERVAVEFDAGDSGATIVVHVDVDGDEWSFGRNYGG